MEFVVLWATSECGISNHDAESVTFHNQFVCDTSWNIMKQQSTTLEISLLSGMVCCFPVGSIVRGDSRPKWEFHQLVSSREVFRSQISHKGSPRPKQTISHHPRSASSSIIDDLTVALGLCHHGIWCH